MSENIVGLDDEPEFIVLKTLDGKSFNIRKDYLNLCTVWKIAFEDDRDSRELLIDNIDSQTLENIVRYLELRKGIDVKIGLSDTEYLAPKVKNKIKNERKYSHIIQSKNMIENLPDNESEVKYIDSISKGDELNNLLKASNSLGIYSLLHLCAMKVASLIKNVDPSEIRDVLMNKDYVPKTTKEETE